VLDYLHSRLIKTAGAVATVFDPPTRGEHIAIVDDEEPIITITSALLQRWGHETAAYSSANGFLKAFSAAPDKFKLLLADVVMPGMSGIQLVRTLRESGCELPVLLMTGFNVQDRAQLAPRSGRIAFVRKPFTALQLEQSVRRMLTWHRSRAPKNQRESLGGESWPSRGPRPAKPMAIMQQATNITSAST
jgi:DNA-binding NtrC family response regulator